MRKYKYIFMCKHFIFCICQEHIKYICQPKTPSCQKKADTPRPDQALVFGGYTRWTTTISSKVNFNQAIDFRFLCGSNLVTWHLIIERNETRVSHRVGGIGTVSPLWSTFGETSLICFKQSTFD